MVTLSNMNPENMTHDLPVQFLKQHSIGQETFVLT